MMLLLLACATGTGGSRVAFDAVAVPTVAPVDGTIEYTDAATGWTVSLTEAEVALGPVYLWSGKPTLSGSLVFPFVSTAWAGADEFLAGYLRGEVLDQVAVDLVAGAEVPIGTGTGTAGTSLSGELWLEPPASGGDTFRIAGTATRDGVVVPFSGALTIDDSIIDSEDGQTPALVRRVRGLPLDAELADGATLRIGVDATRWLAGADFSALLEATPDADGTYPITYPDPVWSIFFYQVRQSGSSGPWSLSLNP